MEWALGSLTSPREAPCFGGPGSACQDGLHPMSSSLKPPGTPDSRLGTAGPGDRSRRAAVTERCSHEGAASARPLSLAPGTVAIPEGQSQGQPPQSREPQGPRLALRSRPHRRPTLARYPYLSGGGNPTRTGRGSRKAGAHAQRWAGLGFALRLTANGGGMKESSCLSRCSLRKDSDAYRLSTTCPLRSTDQFP